MRKPSLYNKVKDIYLCPSTDVRFYEKDVKVMGAGVKTESKDGIFPDTIPEGAENIEYYFTIGQYLHPWRGGKICLKMTVKEDYINHLLTLSHSEEYQGRIDEIDCSILTKDNESEYLLWDSVEEDSRFTVQYAFASKHDNKQ